MMTESGNSPMFTFYWFQTFMFWILGATVAIYRSILAGLIIIFAGPPVSLIVTALGFLLVRLMERILHGGKDRPV